MDPPAWCLAMTGHNTGGKRPVTFTLDDHVQINLHVRSPVFLVLPCFSLFFLLSWKYLKIKSCKYKNYKENNVTRNTTCWEVTLTSLSLAIAWPGRCCWGRIPWDPAVRACIVTHYVIIHLDGKSSCGPLTTTPGLFDLIGVNSPPQGYVTNTYKYTQIQKLMLPTQKKTLISQSFQPLPACGKNKLRKLEY